jgi:hypothetical protein
LARTFFSSIFSFAHKNFSERKCVCARIFHSHLSLLFVFCVFFKKNRMSHDKRQRTYTSSKGAAPPPPERGVSPPPLDRDAFRHMSLGYLRKWDELRRCIPVLIGESDFEVDSTWLHAKRALEERHTKSLPREETSKQLHTRASDSAQWISVEEGLVNASGVFGRCVGQCKIYDNNSSDRDEASVRISRYRLYGTMFYLCSSCMHNIESRKRTLVFRFPFKYGETEIQEFL